VTFPSGPKPHYEFGQSTAQWGKAGILSIDCKPGEIIAIGQKDLRKPQNSEHDLYIMKEDGRITTITRQEAYAQYKKS
jgi:hypothetical protein